LNRAIANIKAIYEEILADINDLADYDKSVDSNKLPKFQSCVLEEKDYGRHWTNSQTPLKTELDVEALLKFFSNSWFWCVMPLCIAQRPSLILTVCSRMWVVQEAVVAPYNEWFCGEHDLNLRIIMRVAVWLSYKSGFIPEALHSHEGVGNTIDLWYLEEVHNPLVYPNTGLETLMSYTSRRRATDLRDKVYGLLGVTKYWRKEKKINDLIRPDYTKPVDRVA
jgi:hypothetical protein